MPSRGAARKPRPAPSKGQSILTENFAEKLLYAVGLSPDSLRGLTEQQLGLKLALAFASVGLPLTTEQSELGPNIRTPNSRRSREKATKELVIDLDETHAEWLKHNLPQGRIMQLDPDSGKAVHYIVSNTELQRQLDNAIKQLSPKEQLLLGELVRNTVTAWAKSEPTSATTSAHAIEPPEPPNHEQHMAQEDNIVVAKTLVKNGIRYLPLSDAAPLAQAHRTTLLRWIKDDTKDDTKFEGGPLQSYYFAPSDTYFISEQSVQRLANRFVKWPSQEPAGPVTLGETDDKSGFIGMSEAADIAGVSRRTMWLWASHTEKRPQMKPLDVIKCTASDYFYIREKDAYSLKKLVPRSGLHRGRRPQPALQP